MGLFTFQVPLIKSRVRWDLNLTNSPKASRMLSAGRAVISKVWPWHSGPLAPALPKPLWQHFGWHVLPSGLYLSIPLGLWSLLKVSPQKQSSQNLQNKWAMLCTSLFFVSNSLFWGRKEAPEFYDTHMELVRLTRSLPELGSQEAVLDGGWNPPAAAPPCKLCRELQWRSPAQLSITITTHMGWDFHWHSFLSHSYKWPLRNGGNPNKIIGSQN